MKASNWIDRVKTEKGWDSDYRVAKELGCKPNTISTYRSSGGPMDEKIAIRVAEILGINPVGVVLDQLAERAKSDQVRATLSRVAGELCILCKVTNAIKSVANGVNSVRALGQYSPQFSREFY